jgi:hypothetical protein
MPAWANTLQAVKMADITMQEVYMTCTECVRAKEILVSDYAKLIDGEMVNDIVFFFILAIPRAPSSASPIFSERAISTIAPSWSVAENPERPDRNQ